jgi:Ca2+-binding EF-hand superfamily protein
MDADGDGRLEENEVDGRRRYFVEMMARRAGIEPKFPISVSRFRDAMVRARENRESEDSSSGRSGSSDGTDEEPLVPGFGVELDLPALLEFGRRAPDDTASAAGSSSRSDSRRSPFSSSRGSSSRGSSSRGSSSRGEPDERFRRWAEVMMRQQDRNRNGRLERDEWNERWGDFREADRNRDGAVRSDELARRLAAFSQNRSVWDRSRSDRSSDSRPSRSNSSGSSGSDSDSNDSDGPKSYRLLTPLERLPEGLPDWFAQKDTNSDGQVAMSEYEPSGFWTASAVDRFARFDLNRDGMITPGECLEALGQSEAGSEVAAAGVPGQLARANGGRPGSGQGSGRPGSGRQSSSTSTEGSDSGGVWEGF